MVELAGIAILLIGSVYAGIESRRTWNMLAAVGAFAGCLIVGFALMAMVPFVGWLVAAAPAVGIVRHAQSTRFRRLASDPDEGPLGPSHASIVFFALSLLAASCARNSPESTCQSDGGCEAECIGCDSSADLGSDDLESATVDAADVGREPLVEPEYSSDPLQALCEKVVFLNVDCLEYHCTVESSDRDRERYREEMLEGTDAIPPCRERAELDGEFRGMLEELAANSCNDEGWRAHQCGEAGYFPQCDCVAPSTLGDLCQSEADCDAGDLTAACEEALSGSYCYAYHCTVPPDAEVFDSRYEDRCGIGNVCSAQPRNWTDANGNLYPDPGEYDGLEGLCARGCRSQSDCPDERACQPLTFGSNAAGVFAVRWCHHSCTADAQCAAGFRCADDGACEFACDSDSATPYTEFCHQIGGECVDDPTRGTDYCVLR